MGVILLHHKSAPNQIFFSIKVLWIIPTRQAAIECDGEALYAAMFNSLGALQT